MSSDKRALLRTGDGGGGDCLLMCSVELFIKRRAVVLLQDLVDFLLEIKR